MKNRVSPAEIVTGLSDFDALAGPIPRERITLAAAPSSAGTTAFALGVARHNDELGHRVVFASFESGTDVIMRNLVAAATSVNTDRPLSIDKGRRARIDRTRAAMEQSRLLVWSFESKTGRWPFKNLMEQLAAQPELDVIVVDGYGQAAYSEPSDGATFAALQQFARERNVAVLVTAHLTPDGTAETDPLALSDLSPAGRLRCQSRDRNAPAPPRP